MGLINLKKIVTFKNIVVLILHFMFLNAILLENVAVNKIKGYILSPVKSLHACFKMIKTAS